MKSVIDVSPLGKRITRVTAYLVLLGVLVAFVGVLTFVFPLNIGLFLGFFVILSFAFPVSIETYQKGWNKSLVMRNVEAVADSQPLKWGLAIAAIAGLVLLIVNTAWLWLLLLRMIFGG
jgi:hypothetical protein